MTEGTPEEPTMEGELEAPHGNDISSFTEEDPGMNAGDIK